MFIIPLSVAIAFSCSVLGTPLKFPDQPSSQNSPQPVAPAQAEGRFLNINKVPNGLFNRLTVSNSLQDDIGDYDDAVASDSGITSPQPSAADVEDRRRHRNRKRPCVPYTPFRSNNVGRQADQGQGRTFFSLFWNDYNFYGGGSQHGSPQYDTYGGYPCYSLGGHQNHRPERPHRPHRPYLEGTNPSGVQSDTADGGGGGNRPGWFLGQGGFVQNWLQSWFLPQSGGSGLLGDSAGGGSASNNVRPIVELNVQDTVQNVVGQRALQRPATNQRP